MKVSYKGLRKKGDKPMEFFVLIEKDSHFKEAYWGDSLLHTIKRCPKCEGVSRKLDSPLTISFTAGKDGDYYRAVQYNIVSPTFQKLLLENNLSGFQLDDIKIEDSKGNINNTLIKQMDIIGRGGILRDIHGQEILNCSICHRVIPSILERMEGLGINQDHWDGSDIFYFDNWVGTPIVTEKVKRILQVNNITNIKLINIKDYIFNKTYKDWVKRMEKEK